MSAIPEGANADCPGGPTAAGAGTASACDGCPNQAACASGVKTVDPALARVAARLAGVKHIVLVLSGKGGVGKSTFSSQLAFTLSEQGCSVGLLDVDICGPSIPRMLGAVGAKVHQSASGWSPVWLTESLGVMSIGFMLPEEDDAVIWRGPKKNGIIQQFLGDVEWGELDYLVVDTPPGTSDEHISMVQLLRGEGDKPSNLAGAVVVTTPQEVAMADVRKELNFCVKTNLPVLGVVENMSGFACPCCGTNSEIFKASGAGPRGMAEKYSVPFLGALPIDPLLLACCEKGEAYVVKHAGSPGAVAFQGVVDAVRRGVEASASASASSSAVESAAGGGGSSAGP